MMRNLFLITLFCIFAITVSAQNSLKAYLNEKQFYNPEIGNFIEVQIQFAGHTIKYEKLKGKVQLTQIFSQNGKIVKADKYELNTPEIRDSIVEDFYDLQRYTLAPGTYKYELRIKDLKSDQAEIVVNKDLVIEDLSKDIVFSDITLADGIRLSKDQNAFTKYGYDVIPMLSNYYPTQLSQMPFYVELYNADKYLNDSVFIVQQKIYDVDGSKEMTEFTRNYKFSSVKSIQAIAKNIDISFLPAGSYIMEVNVTNRNKKVLAQNVINFDRNNDDVVAVLSLEDEIIDPTFAASVTTDSLNYYVGSLIPISKPAEVKNILDLLKENDTTKLRKYHQLFWKQSASSLKSTENWLKYKIEVQKVEHLYSTNFQSGYETDRGRVYLQYGAPSSVQQRPTSPTEYPYEIWQYDKIARTSNKRFVFYNPDLVNNTYRLLHSDLIGELQNYRWQYYLQQRTSTGNNIDDPTGGAGDSHGVNSSRYYNNY